jgi:hypothetical protein
LIHFPYYRVSLLIVAVLLRLLALSDCLLAFVTNTHCSMFFISPMTNTNDSSSPVAVAAGGVHVVAIHNDPEGGVAIPETGAVAISSVPTPAPAPAPAPLPIVPTDLELTTVGMTSRKSVPSPITSPDTAASQANSVMAGKVTTQVDLNRSAWRNMETTGFDRNVDGTSSKLLVLRLPSPLASYC